MMGAGMGEEIDRGMEEAGLPSVLLGGGGGGTGGGFLSMDPRSQMADVAAFSRIAADAERQRAAQPELERANARENVNQMAQFMDMATLVGTETVDGRTAFHLRAENVNQVHKEDDQEFNMQHISMWIDAKEYVPLKMKVDGIVTSKDGTRPMTIENLQTDYRVVPNSKMYESYKRVMKISGMMTPEQEAQMAEAQQQMAQYEEQMGDYEQQRAEFEKQLESMPPAQRKMMETMMGPRLDAIKRMTDGGGFNTEIIVHSITVNPAVLAIDGTPCPASSANQVQLVAVEDQNDGPYEESTTAAIMERGMVEMIQGDLNTLGYNTGTVTGEMNTQTAIAISQYQAENDMDVTGEVSPQLAGVLAARANRVREEAADAAPSRDPAALQAAQQACLQEKVAAAQESQKKKRGLGRLVSGIGRVASRVGSGIGGDLARTASDVYTANATADDFAAAAKDLGLTEDEVEECRNPM
jgi:hypothetical protein